MEFKFKVQLGSTEIEINERAESHEELFRKASFFMELPKTCSNCGESHLGLSHRLAGGYDFYSVKCQSCKHELKFGQSKENKGTLFPKGWEPPYNGNSNSLESGSNLRSIPSEPKKTTKRPSSFGGARRENTKTFTPVATKTKSVEVTTDTPSLENTLNKFLKKK